MHIQKQMWLQILKIWVGKNKDDVVDPKLK